MVAGFVGQTGGAAEDVARAELLELVLIKEEVVIMLDVLLAADEDAHNDIEELDESPEQSAGRGLVCVITRLSIAISTVVVVLVDPCSE